MSDNKLILWHIRAYYKKVAHQLSYKKHNDNPAYGWLLSTLVEKRIVVASDEIRFAWFAYDGSHKKKPDLRNSWLMPAKTACVLEKWEVPITSVALMQFEMWVYILNDWYIPESDEHADWFEKQKPSYQRRHLRDNWHCVFDMEWGDDRRWGMMHRRSIQACTNINKVVCVNKSRFIAR